jgi:glycine/D-amino acid oxidase-like deaminating enzyme
LSKIDTTLERVSLGWRVMPQDEFPIIGFADACPNLYVIATHSGITLSALFGELATSEIMDGPKTGILDPYRLSRF